MATTEHLINPRGEPLVEQDNDPARTLLNEHLVVESVPDYVGWWNNLTTDQQQYFVGIALAYPVIRQAENVTKELWEVRNEVKMHKAYPPDEQVLSTEDGGRINNRKGRS